MVEETAIPMLQERLDRLCFSLSLHLEQLDFAAAEVDATVMSAPHLLFKESMLSRGRVEITDI